jgi:hypothetical protein
LTPRSEALRLVAFVESIEEPEVVTMRLARGGSSEAGQRPIERRKVVENGAGVGDVRE